MFFSSSPLKSSCVTTTSFISPISIMFRNALIISISLMSTVSSSRSGPSSSEIIDVTLADNFELHVQKRSTIPWAVLFIDSDPTSNSDSANIVPAFWRSAAKKNEQIVKLGYVNCANLVRINKNNGGKTGFADSFCAEAKKRRNKDNNNGSKSSSKSKKSNSQSDLRKFGYSIQGYTYDELSGSHLLTSLPFNWSYKTLPEPSLTKLNKWLTGYTDSSNKNGLLPNLVVGLTAHQGTNVFHKETLSKFLQYRSGTIHKALFFTTSPKGSDPPPVLLKSLAIKWRQRLLIAEVKASDTVLRKAFDVKDVPSLIVIKPGGGKENREMFKGKQLKRESVEKFLEKFVKISNKNNIGTSSGSTVSNSEESSTSTVDNDIIPTLHSDLKSETNIETEHVKVKRQSYSNADSNDKNFPRGFDPWKTLGLKPSSRLPSKDDLKQAYRNVSKKYHPDKCGRGTKSSTKKKFSTTDPNLMTKDQCETKMSQAGIANEVLSDSRRLMQWEAWREDTRGGTRVKSEL